MISYSLYELESKSALNAVSEGVKRQGALLKVEFEDGTAGYADCFSWPELGDLPLKRQLELLAVGQLTPITSSALALAQIDAKARSNQEPLLKDIPESHFLLSDLGSFDATMLEKIVRERFTHIKIKLGRQIDLEVEKLFLFKDSSLKLRLDFNETATPSTFRLFLQRIEELKNQIDFIEDPFAFHPKEWRVFQNEGWRFAADRDVNVAKDYPESAAVLIVKPAIHSWQEWKNCEERERIVTSYLGHPFGQTAAAYAASHLDPSSHFVHGLLSHRAYQPNPFSLQLNWEGPSFAIPPGNGFGFDRELCALEWRVLK